MLVAARRDEGLPRWLSGEESAFQGKRRGFNPWVGKSPWVGNGHLLQPEKLLGQRSLVSYSPWGGKESDTTERLRTGQHISAWNSLVASSKNMQCLLFYFIGLL